MQAVITINLIITAITLLYYYHLPFDTIGDTAIIFVVGNHKCIIIMTTASSIIRPHV